MVVTLHRMKSHLLPKYQFVYPGGTHPSFGEAVRLRTGLPAENRNPIKQAEIKKTYFSESRGNPFTTPLSRRASLLGHQAAIPIALNSYPSHPDGGLGLMTHTRDPIIQSWTWRKKNPIGPAWWGIQLWLSQPSSSGGVWPLWVATLKILSPSLGGSL